MDFGVKYKKICHRLYEGFKSIYGDILKALSEDMVNGNIQFLLV